uniref:Uncharacterized protein n=1 Tax=Panagrolaimus superbus TaxID=310955 RepID=A0A914XXG6_9BILA
MEDERLRLNKKMSVEEKDRLNEYYKRIRIALPARLDSFRGVQPMLSDIEKRLREVETYIQQGDSTYLGRLQIRERAEYLEQAGYLIDTLEEKHSDIISPGQLRLSFTSLRSGFTFPSSLDAPDSFTAPGPSTSSLQRVTHLRDRFEPPPSPNIRSRSPNYVDRVADLLERKRRILDRREDSAAGAKASILEMEMINESLILHNALEHPQFQPMESEWKTKLSQMERLVLIDSELEKLAQRLRVAEKPSEFALIESDIEGISRKFTDLTIDLPLLTISQRKISSLRKNVGEQKSHQTKRVFDRFEIRLRELEMTPEEDIAIAEIIMKTFPIFNHL